MRNKFPSRPVMERFEEKYIPVPESGCRSGHDRV